MNEEKEQHEGKIKETTEKLWGKTRKTLHSAAFLAGQYKRVVQKKIDLAAIHKKISGVYADLGKLIDESRETGGEDILARQEVQSLFAKLDELKNAAVRLEHEIEDIKAEHPAEEEGEKTD